MRERDSNVNHQLLSDPIDSRYGRVVLTPDMSESVRNQLQHIDPIISYVKGRLSVVRAEQKTLEDELAVLEAMAKLGSEYLAKESPPQMQPVSPGVRPPSRRKTGMREGSRKQRIWSELFQMLVARKDAIHRGEIIDRMVEIGLIEEDRKESVANLLSEFRKAGLVDTDGRGWWFLAPLPTVPAYEPPIEQDGAP